MSETFGFYISDIARLFRRRFEAQARVVGVTGPQWRVMFTLARNPGLNQSQLADILEVEPITTCRMVDRMEQAGLAERRRDPKDRRAWQIHLTDAAIPMLEELKSFGEGAMEGALAGLSPQEADQLLGLLIRVRDNLIGSTNIADDSDSDSQALEAARG